MKKIFLKAFIFLFAIAVTQSCNEPVLEDPTSSELMLKSAISVKKEYIVLINDADLSAELSTTKGYERKQQVMKSASAKIMRRSGITDGEVGFVYGTAVKGFSVKITPGQLRKLQNDPSVKYIEESQEFSLIQPYAKPEVNAVTVTAAQETPWGITRVKGGVDGTGKTVWIIDTGVDLDHPDLIVDASRGETFIDRTTTPDDDNGHGSHVAGTIAAKNNTEGVIGVAAGATVVPVKVLDSRGSGTTTGVIAGIDFVAENANAGDVANMSLGGGVSDALDAAVISAADKGILFALAAGNESDDANNHSPARVNGANIYTISASDINDEWAYFSNYGNPPVDYCEPGVNIYSCYKDGGYVTMSGTSMAAPHMAGLLALGDFGTDGYVSGDPDGNADPIGVFGGSVTPPTNTPPVADFTFSTTDLTVTFTDQSSDADGSVTSWNWNFGDGNSSSSQNPVYTYSTDGTYTVQLTVTDNDGATNSTSENVTVTAGSTGTEITLEATGYKIRGVRYVDLTWSGATGTDVEIFLGGTLVATTANDGTYTHNLGRSSGTYTFTVCETDGSACSNDATATI